MLRQVAAGVLIHESEFMQSNAVVVQVRAGLLLIDLAVTGSEFACLANDLRELGQPVVAGSSTHPHWDHLLWHAGLGAAPRYGTARCAATVRDHEFDRLLAGEADELSVLTKQRDKMEDEQLKLMQAHYADAIPLAVLKKEQSRISAELDQLNSRLERHHREYADAKAVLTRCLDLLASLGDLYARCDDLTRQLCNQALFTKVYVDDDQTLRPQHTPSRSSCSSTPRSRQVP